MSDSDAGGDDDFDKEAEREKLREKYERDQKRREATQQMSELLLKGATMTDHHCDDCGSPIFRYDGEEFCPTCAGTRETSEGDAGDATSAGDAASAGDATSAGDAASAGDVPAQGGSPAEADAGPGGEAAGKRGGGRVPQGGQPAGRQGTSGHDHQHAAGGGQGASHGGAGGTGGTGGTSAAGATGGGADAGSGAGAGDGELGDAELEAARARLDDRVGSRSTGGRGTDRRREPSVGDSPVQQGAVPSMAQTRAALRRAIVSLSEQAAQSDDPPRAHELLKGAREASEALAALEGTTGE